MRKLASTLLLCLPLLLATPGRAASFKVVGAGDDYIAFVDSDDATTSGAIKNYDLLFITLPPRIVEGQPMHYMMEHEKLDCRQQTIQVLTVSAYGTNGQIIDKSDSPEPEEIIFPESLSDAQFNLLCRGVRIATQLPEYSTLPLALKAGDEYIKEHVSMLPTHR